MSTIRSSFGAQLKAWRKRRGLSQLELSLLARTTSRYISFLETGRSRPGQDIVLRLAEALDVPIQTRNTLLQAAGLPPAYSEKQLTDQALDPIWQIIDRVLENHEPYPASVITSGLRFVKQNRAAERLFPGACERDPAQMLHDAFAPGMGRDTLVNWQEVLYFVIVSLRHEMLHDPHPSLPGLLTIAESYAPEDFTPPMTSELPVLCATFLLQDTRLKCMSTVMKFDRALDVTTASLRVELMFPADEATDAFFLSFGE